MRNNGRQGTIFESGSSKGELPVYLTELLYHATRPWKNDYREKGLGY